MIRAHLEVPFLEAFSRFSERRGCLYDRRVYFVVDKNSVLYKPYGIDGTKENIYKIKIKITSLFYNFN